MKKLMVAVAAIAMAVVGEAATAEWASGTMYLSGDGVYVGKSKDSSQVPYTRLGSESTIYLFAGMQLTDWETFTSTDGIWSKFDVATGKLTVGGNAISATETKSFNNGLAKFDYSPSIGEGSYDYTVVVVTHKDAGGNIDYYAANAVGVEGGEMECIGADSVALYWDLAGEGDPSLWVANSVPEPTSGLLLLLGVAGLALRRRRA